MNVNSVTYMLDMCECTFGMFCTTCVMVLLVIDKLQKTLFFLSAASPGFEKKIVNMRLLSS